MNCSFCANADAGADAERGDRRRPSARSSPASCFPPSFAAARVGRRPSRRNIPQRQCGNGQSRNFSLPICHSRASPRGSTIRKKTISAPKTIDSQIGHQIDRHLEPDEPRRVIEQDRQQHDEGGAEERAEDAAEAADDDHEQDLERAVDVEGAGLDRARIDEGPHRAGDAAVERADGEGEQLGFAAAGCR